MDLTSYDAVEDSPLIDLSIELSNHAGAGAGAGAAGDMSDDTPVVSVRIDKHKDAVSSFFSVEPRKVTVAAFGSAPLQVTCDASRIDTPTKLNAYLEGSHSLLFLPELNSACVSFRAHILLYLFFAVRSGVCFISRPLCGRGYGPAPTAACELSV